jgi:hypothetical protein
VRFCGDCVTTCEDVAPKFGENRPGYFTMTTHTSVLTQQIRAKNTMAVIAHPPYSPDLAPYDFFLFIKVKLKMKGCRLNTIEEIQA